MNLSNQEPSILVKTEETYILFCFTVYFTVIHWSIGRYISSGVLDKFDEGNFASLFIFVQLIKSSLSKILN